MVPELILTALASASVGGAYMRWRVKPDLEDLDRWRAVSSLRDVPQSSEEYVMKVLGPCPACKSSNSFTNPPCACSRRRSHGHMKCPNCGYEFVVDPLDPNAH